MISFACYELGMRLWDVKCMTWAEFQIKAYGYWREKERSGKEVRYIAYHSLIGPHVDPKTLPKSFAKFIGEVPKVSEKAISFYQQEMKKFRELQKK